MNFNLVPADFSGSMERGREMASRENMLAQMPSGQQMPPTQNALAAGGALDVAGRALGLNETDKKVALQDYLETGGVNIDPAVRAWCADFVNATLAQTGKQGTGSGMARSFLEWGNPVDTPQRGDVAVFSRGDPNGPYGHVGFFDSYNPDGSLRILGGNQGNSVSYANYPADNLLAFRRG